MTPRRIRSMSSGARPVFTTWPPSITTTPRLSRAALAIASTTARKSRATSTSGKRGDERGERAVVARADARTRAALTLFGRRATGTVRIGGEIRLARSVGARCLRNAVQRSVRRRRWAVRFEVEAEGSEADLRLHLQHDAVLVVGKPDLGVSAFGEQLRSETAAG